MIRTGNSGVQAIGAASVSHDCCDGSHVPCVRSRALLETRLVRPLRPLAGAARRSHSPHRLRSLLTHSFAHTLALSSPRVHSTAQNSRDHEAHVNLLRPSFVCSSVSMWSSGPVRRPHCRIDPPGHRSSPQEGCRRCIRCAAADFAALRRRAPPAAF